MATSTGQSGQSTRKGAIYRDRKCLDSNCSAALKDHRRFQNSLNEEPRSPLTRLHGPLKHQGWVSVREEREVRLSSPPSGNIQPPSCGIRGDGKASNPEKATITDKKSPQQQLCIKRTR